MPQSKILVDTNVYIRLAQSIRPLLFTPFGDAEYCLYVIPDLNKELSNRRLSTKFAWVNEEEYVDNRKHYPKVSRKQQKSIQDTFQFVWDHVESELPGPSRVDALYIAHGMELDIPVVTDDNDMIELAETFDAQFMRTLDLLKLMLDAGHIDMQKIDSVVAYWKYVNDAPGNLAKHYKKLFKKTIK